MTESQTLLAQYARTRSEAAFRELVSRYIDLVYSAAFRLVGGDVESAQDVTQTVFVALADKARTLPEDVMLGGWLHQHTRFVAGKLMRTERRRRLRERQAAEMNVIEDHTQSNLAQVAPVLDEAIGQLDAEDRTAILLRFFEQKDFRGVGEALGSSEEAARKRVDRALEKLHVHLTRRGATLSAAALGTALATEAVTAAPAGLAASIAGAALASAPAGGGGASTVINLLAMTKLKVGIASAILVACVAIPVVVLNQSRNKSREEERSLQGQIAQLAADNERLSNLVARGDGAPRQARPAEQSSLELLRLRNKVGLLTRQLDEAATGHLGKAAPLGMESSENDPEMAKYEALYKSKSQFSRQLLSALVTYRSENQGRLPATMDQVVPLLSDKARAQTNWTADQFQVVDPSSCSVLTNSNWGVMVREREPWHAFGSNWGRIHGWIQAGAARESSAFIIEGEKGALEKWEAQQKWEMDYNQPQR